MRKKKMLTIITITSFLIVFFFVGLYVVGLRGEAYQSALEYIDNNELIVKNIGKIKNRRLSFFGYSVKHSGPRGHAEYKLLVKGENDKGNVYLELEKSVGIWKVVQGNLVLDNGEVVQLLKGRPMERK